VVDVVQPLVPAQRPDARHHPDPSVLDVVHPRVEVVAGVQAAHDERRHAGRQRRLQQAPQAERYEEDQEQRRADERRRVRMVAGVADASDRRRAVHDPAVEPVLEERPADETRDGQHDAGGGGPGERAGADRDERHRAGQIARERGPVVGGTTDHRVHELPRAIERHGCTEVRPASTYSRRTRSSACMGSMLGQTADIRNIGSRSV
jgi:hypothetical protein